MKKKIAILGSTGSIGQTLINIISKNKKNFKIVLLTTNKNYRKLFDQAKKFNVKNLIITDKKIFLKIKNDKISKGFNISNNFENLEKVFKNSKIDYVMSSIIGIDGLYPTIKIIKHTKKIAIANKEAIICGWSLIRKELFKYKTKFIPVDSEHFSVWFGTKDNSNNISKIYLTASGGPFLKKNKKSLNNISISSALNHPNWRMGKKISIDSATMMNKVFEIIEARNIFDIPLNKISILTHPKSYIHAIIKFTNGMIKLIAHDTTMEIPIFNTLFSNENKKFKSFNIKLDLLNNLEFCHVDKERFLVVKILDKLKNNYSLFETIIVSANDALVNLYLQKKIKFNEISLILLKFIQKKQFEKYKVIRPKKIQNILDLDRYVRLKINSMCI
jgi:1-deoxy-D-xylulose-5-phosphate reductoisomerase